MESNELLLESKELSPVFKHLRLQCLVLFLQSLDFIGKLLFMLFKVPHFLLKFRVLVSESVLLAVDPLKGGLERLQLGFQLPILMLSLVQLGQNLGVRSRQIVLHPSHRFLNLAYLINLRGCLCINGEQGVVPEREGVGDHYNEPIDSRDDGQFLSSEQFFV